jgi:hypothetical protein
VNNYNTDSTTALFVNILTRIHFSNNFLAVMLIFPRFSYWPLGVTDDGDSPHTTHLAACTV